MIDERCEKCGNCKYYLSLDERNLLQLLKDIFKGHHQCHNGTCHKAPPTDDGYPNVRVDDWCGEWKPKRWLGLRLG